MEKLIEKLAQDFKSSVSDDALKETLAIKFKNMIEGTYKKFEEKNYDYDEIEDTLKKISEEWCSLSLEEKQSRLLKDENFSEILEISKQAYNNAIHIMQGFEINVAFNIEERETRLRELIKGVKPYNEERANREVSEGLLDLNFIKNPNTDIVSLRLGHILRSRNYIKNEEGRQ